MKYYFPIARIETYIFIPPLVSFLLALFCSTAGVSGAFLLLPFQVSILHYLSPSVSATNHLFNVIAIPSGVYRYWKEKRLYYPITLLITIGTFPGVILGYILRITLFESLKNFKLLIGTVLFIIAAKLLYEVFHSTKTTSFSSSPPKTLLFKCSTLVFEYGGNTYRINPLYITLLSFIVGIIGGIYGIGGGALMAPILFAFFHIPPYVFAGATLFGTFLTSILGVIIYTLGGHGPDYLLGFLFGLGGLVGMYLGAKWQKYLPQKIIRLILTVVILFISFQYILDFLRK
ncbi:MAG: sulfite exporter TauE/SafE family protein [Caldimicrobium sp.]